MRCAGAPKTAREAEQAISKYLQPTCSPWLSPESLWVPPALPNLEARHRLRSEPRSLHRVKQLRDRRAWATILHAKLPPSPGAAAANANRTSGAQQNKAKRIIVAHTWPLATRPAPGAIKQNWQRADMKRGNCAAWQGDVFDKNHVRRDTRTTPSQRTAVMMRLPIMVLPACSSQRAVRQNNAARCTNAATPCSAWRELRFLKTGWFCSSALPPDRALLRELKLLACRPRLLGRRPRAHATTNVASRSGANQSPP